MRIILAFLAIAMLGHLCSSIALPKAKPGLATEQGADCYAEWAPNYVLTDDDIARIRECRGYE